MAQGSLLLSAKNAWSCLRLSAVTVTDSARGRLTKEICDARLDAWCRGAHGHVYTDCTRAEQLALLESLAYGAKHTAQTEAGRGFFQLLRDYTVAGYYTSRPGLEALGFAGLKSTWEAMPACPHVDDPDHLHLPAPVA